MYLALFLVTLAIGSLGLSIAVHKSATKLEPEKMKEYENAIALFGVCGFILLIFALLRIGWLLWILDGGEFSPVQRSTSLFWPI